jgi:hypothetical protein
MTHTRSSNNDDIEVLYYSLEAISHKKAMATSKPSTEEEGEEENVGSYQQLRLLHGNVGCNIHPHSCGIILSVSALF